MSSDWGWRGDKRLVAVCRDRWIDPAEIQAIEPSKADPTNHTRISLSSGLVVIVPVSTQMVVDAIRKALGGDDRGEQANESWKRAIREECHGCGLFGEVRD